MPFFFDMSYFYLVLPAVILAMWAQSNVGSTYRKFSSVAARSGMTGAEAASRLLSASGIYDVRIERVAGNLTDHYDPRSKVLRLSDSVYSSRSIAAIGVAAHETGHAIQHATGYAFLKLRSIMIPITGIGSNAAMPLILLGILFGGSSSSIGNTLITLGIAFFAVAVAFSFVTLPVEFNASSRALDILEENRILALEEIGGAKKVLKAAAMTYVASAAVALANLLRLIMLFGRRRD